METIIQGLVSSDVKIKLSTAEALLSKLNGKSIAGELSNDVKMRLMTNILSTVKDANPRVAGVALECLKLIVDNYGDSFHTHTNLMFDLMITKSCDAKASLRSLAAEIILSLINLMGVSSGYDKLMGFCNHKNYHVREQIANVVMKLFDIYGDEIVVIPNLCAKLSTLLLDTQLSVRQLTVEALVKLGELLGNTTVIEELQSIGVRAIQINLVQEAMSQNGTLCKKSVIESQDVDEMDDLSHDLVEAREVVDRAATHLSATMNTTRKSSQTSANNLPEFGNPCDSASTMSLSPDGTYAASNMFSLLEEGSVVSHTKVYSDKDIGKIFAVVLNGLTNTEDWQARIAALVTLQGLVLGDGMCYDQLLVQQLRSCQDLMGLQIVDLRSVVSKEACRVVAQICRKVGAGSAPMFEMWLPSLLKQITVKVQVMCAAADKVVKIALCSNVGGYGRTLAILLENCLSKNSVVRRHCFSYVALACALWKAEALDRQMPQLKNVIKTGVADADPAARKAARQLYWVLRSRGQKLSSSSPMHSHHFDSFLLEFDTTAQKHIQSEQQNPCADLLDLLQLVQNPNTYDEWVRDGRSSDAASSSSQKKLIETEKKSGGTLAGTTRASIAASIGLTANRRQSLATTTGSGLPLSSSSMKSAAMSSTPSTMAMTNKKIMNEIEVPDVVTGLDDAIDEFSLESSTPFQPTVSKSLRRTSLLSGGAFMPLNSTQLRSTGEHSSVQSMMASRRQSLAVPPQRSLAAAATITENKDDASEASESCDANDRRSARRTSLLSNIVKDRKPSTAMDVVDESYINSGMQIAESATSSKVGLVEGPKRVVNKPSVMAANTSNPLSEMKAVRILANPVAPIVTENMSNQLPAAVASIQSEPSRTEETRVSTKSRTVSMTDTKKESETTDVAFTNENVRSMADDPHWGVRVKVFETINMRLEKATTISSSWSSSTSSATSVDGSSIAATMLEICLDVAVNHLGDTHHKVATEAMQVIHNCVQKFPTQTSGKMAAFLTALFQRLADHRPHIREQANNLLNTVRQSYDPVVIVAALAPKIVDIPERMKTAVMQFLGAIVPHCESYFLQTQNTWAFLGRMAIVLGGNGNSKPSPAMAIVGRRLLELVYKTIPQIFCSQVALLPLQQQFVIKKSLQPAVPEIDTLVNMAAKSDWHKSSATKSQVLANSTTAPSQDKARDDDVKLCVGRISNSIESSLPSNQPMSLRLRPANHSEDESVVKDIAWMLASLRPEADRQDKLNAIKEIKRLIKSGDVLHWSQYCPQVISVLLESFAVPISSKVALKATSNRRSQPLDKDAMEGGFSSNLVLTGLSPDVNLRAKGVENEHTNNSNYWNRDSEDPRNSNTTNSSTLELQHTESMHLACKGLQLLVKHCMEYAKSFLNLIISRLCQAAATAPVAVQLYFEDILGALAMAEPVKFTRAILPFAATTMNLEIQAKMQAIAGMVCDSNTLAHVGSPGSPKQDREEEYSSPHVRLLTLHVLPVAIKRLSSSQLLTVLPDLITSILPSHASALVDIRKAVIFVLVEAYLVIGDALHPYLSELGAPQRKLLTFYIDRQMKQSDQASSNL